MINQTLDTATTLAISKRFLSFYYKKTKSDDIGSLFSELNLHVNGTTWDSATGGEWRECCKQVTEQPEAMTIEEAFMAMKKYLGMYVKATHSKEIPPLLNKLHIPKRPNCTNKHWNRWLEYAQKKSIEIDCLLYKICPFFRCFYQQHAQVYNRQ